MCRWTNIRGEDGHASQVHGYCRAGPDKVCAKRGRKAKAGLSDCAGNGVGRATMSVAEMFQGRPWTSTALTGVSRRAVGYPRIRFCNSGPGGNRAGPRVARSLHDDRFLALVDR